MKQEKNRKTLIGLLPLLILMLVLMLGLQSGAVTAEINSMEGVLTWGDPVHISTNSPNGAFVPTIAQAPDGTIMIVYNHTTAGGFELPYFVQSSNNGNNWSPPNPVRSGTQDISQATFTFDSNSVAHAVWRTNTDILYSAEGNWPTAGTPVVATAGAVIDPDIGVANNGTIHVVWAQSTALQDNIYHAYSTSGGAGWTLSPPLATDARKSSGPTISIDNSGNVHIAWVERMAIFPDLVTEIRYKKGTWSGNTLTFNAVPTTISNLADNSNHKPEIATSSNGRVHVSYSRGALNVTSDQYPMYAQFNGTAWLAPVDITGGNPVNVNQSTPFYLKSTIASCDNLYIYYHGALSPTAKEQILGHNNGDNWAYREQVTESDTRNINPSLACNCSQLFLALERIEESGPNAGTSQIYFIGDTGGGIFLPAIMKN
jgi:hypothetical protein